MKKGLLLVYSVLFCVSLSAEDKLNKSNDYIAHCNFTYGLSMGIGGIVSGSDSLKISAIDGFNDIYTFNYDPTDDSNSILGLNIMLSIPFYYRTVFSTGLYGQALLHGLSGDDLLLYYGGGFYAEGNYKHFSARAGFGLVGITMSKSLGNLTPAWAGDPGFYTGSKFIDIGDKLTASSTDYLGLSYNLAFKYYPFKKQGFLGGLFLQLGYYFFPGINVSEYELSLDGYDIDTVKKLPSFKVEPIHTICFMVGIGL